MQSILPIEARQLATMIASELGSTFSVNDAIAFVSGARNKQVIVLEKLVDVAYLGLCFSFTNCDLIIIAPRLSRRLYLITILHELMHIFRGEAKHYNKNYDKSIHDQIMSLDMVHRHADTVYGDLPDDIRLREDIAEAAASLLFEFVWRNEESIPAMVQRIYGYKE